ncbi:uncharacterized protein LOC119084889 [Bradysia coprophila]|uniref:uncharacterized protein LOC119084889 n=1 Tax=Bradysia coprophila TaxID=38358 RepID=UPI00187DBA8F|nr:uncharacterized protein LOC119084889 [Bradysia coprophila]
MQLFVFIFVVFLACQLNIANAQDSICRRTTVGRGAGSAVVSLCNADEQEVASLCYPRCQNGYENIGSNICRKIGCDGLIGATDIGVSCEKPPAYGRGAGYIFTDQQTCIRENGSCEMWGAMWYPTCRFGYSPFGCCICSPNCPREYIDDGAFCQKPSYGRGVGVSRLGCASGLQYDAGLCYIPCPSDRNGVGPLCWSRCGGQTPVECGIFCTSSAEKCADITLQIVGSAVRVAANLAGTNVLGAILAIFDGANQIMEPNSC